MNIIITVSWQYGGITRTSMASMVHIDRPVENKFGFRSKIFFSAKNEEDLPYFDLSGDYNTSSKVLVVKKWNDKRLIGIRSKMFITPKNKRIIKREKWESMTSYGIANRQIRYIDDVGRKTKLVRCSLAMPYAYRTMFDENLFRWPKYCIINAIYETKSIHLCEIVVNDWSLWEIDRLFNVISKRIADSIAYWEGAFAKMK